MKKKSSLLECLVLIQNFETLWAYYAQSNGLLYSEQCRKAALRLVESIDRLVIEKPDLFDTDKIWKRSTKNLELDPIKNLGRWGKGEIELPYDKLFTSKGMLFIFFSQFKKYLLKELKVTKFPIMVFSSVEEEYTARVIRWKPHMPRIALLHNPDLLLHKASETQTIAIVGDIRRSQELMVYAASPEEFSTRMVTFIKTTRTLIEQHNGFFDKFTGDGFIVYFNEAICADADKNYIDCFLDFVREEIDFAISFFDEWEQNIRKRPTDRIGLAIGADTGIINFADINDHLVAVGDAIVWASRMASVGGANEIVINNLLFNYLNVKDNVSFQSFQCKTKYGESFLANKLLFNN